MQKVAAKNTAMSPGALMKIDGAARCNAAVLMRCVQIVISGGPKKTRRTLDANKS